jgi:hypothetical protein
MLVAGLFPLSALAQLYPVPYAVVTPEPPLTVVNTGGDVVPGVAAGRANRIFGDVFGFHNKRFAENAAVYLNRMAAASNECNRYAYDRAVADYRKLVELVAQAVHVAAQQLSVTDIPAITTPAGYRGGKYHYEETTPAVTHENPGKYQEYLNDSEDERYLEFNIPLPKFRDCGQKQAAAPPPQPPPPATPEAPPNHGLYIPGAVPHPAPPPSSDYRPQDEVMMVGPYGSPNVIATMDVVDTYSMWKETSPTDQVKTTSNTPQLQFTGQLNWGQFFLSVAAMGAGDTRGNFSDTFFGFPMVNTGTVTDGSNTAFTTSAGFNFINLPGLTVGAFGVYYLDLEALYGNTIFSGSGYFSLLETRSQAGGGGLIVNDAFSVGNMPFVFSASAAALADNVTSGTFNGDGDGWQANAKLTFPLGPVHANIFGQFTDINASGSPMGVPLTFSNKSWTFGAGLTGSWGLPH